MSTVKRFTYQVDGSEPRGAKFSRRTFVRDLAGKLGLTNHTCLLSGRRIGHDVELVDGGNYNFIEQVKGNVDSEDMDDVCSSVQEMDCEQLVQLLRTVFSRIIGERQCGSGSSLELEQDEGITLD